MAFISELKSGIVSRIVDGVNAKAEKKDLNFKITEEEVFDWLFGVKSASPKHGSGLLETLENFKTAKGKEDYSSDKKSTAKAKRVAKDLSSSDEELTSKKKTTKEKSASKNDNDSSSDEELRAKSKTSKGKSKDKDDNDSSSKNQSIIYQASNLLSEGVNKSTLNKFLPNIKRGDIVHFGDDDYRNNGKEIFDGNKLISLAHDLDEYEHLPSSFTLNEFSHEYFDKSIAHNNIRWLKMGIIDEIGKLNNVDGPTIFFTVTYNNGRNETTILTPPIYANAKNIQKKILDSDWYQKYRAIPLEDAEAFFGKKYRHMYTIYLPGTKGFDYEEK